MRDSSSHLFQSLFDSYALDWEGGEDLGSVVEVYIMHCLKLSV